MSDPQPSTAVEEAAALSPTSPSTAALQVPHSPAAQSDSSKAKPASNQSKGAVPTGPAARSGERGANQGGYVNPSRHLSTGGPQRTKLTPEELEAKMAKAREANAALVQRQEEIDKDKAAFNELTAQDRKAREEASRKKVAEKKAQLALEEERNKNRERKLEKQEGRMWDAEKQDEGGALWEKNFKPYSRGYDDSNSRGGYGDSRGRGRAGYGVSRGGRGGATNSKGRELIDTTSKSEFPALGNSDKKIPTGPKSQNQNSNSSPKPGKNATPPTGPSQKKSNPSSPLKEKSNPTEGAEKKD